MELISFVAASLLLVIPYIPYFWRAPDISCYTAVHLSLHKASWCFLLVLLNATIIYTKGIGLQEFLPIFWQANVQWGTVCLFSLTRRPAVDSLQYTEQNHPRRQPNSRNWQVVDREYARIEPMAAEQKIFCVTTVYHRANSVISYYN